MDRHPVHPRGGIPAIDQHTSGQQPRRDRKLVLDELVAGEQIAGVADGKACGRVHDQRLGEPGERVGLELVVGIEVLHDRALRPAEGDITGDRGALQGSIRRWPHPRIPSRTDAFKDVEHGGRRPVDLETPDPVGVGLRTQRFSVYHSDHLVW